MIEQGQVDAFDAIRGRTGTHYHLADLAEGLGLTVAIDAENNSLSLVILPGVQNPDGSDVVIGRIEGDTEARIV